MTANQEAPARMAGAPGLQENHHADGVEIVIERPAPRKSARAQILGELVDDALATGADLDAWEAAGGACSAFLTERELLLLSWALARTLSPRAAVGIIEVAFPSSGPPIPPFTDPKADAADWAARASRDELRAYATAAFKALDRADRRRFAAWAARRAK